MALGRVRSLWRHLFRKAEAERALDDEVRSYEALLTEQKIGEGLTPAEASRAARIELGGTEQVKEEVRARRPGAWMDALRQDIRHGMRVLGANPGFTSLAILTLALGIGVNTAIFSMVNSLLLRPLPVTEPKQITVLAYTLQHGSFRTDFSFAGYRDLRTQTDNVFSGLAGYQIGMDGLSINGKAERILSAYVSGNFFSVLGLRPAWGRGILSSEGESAGGDPIAVLGYSYWETHFGADPAVVGKNVSINGHPFTIVGVGPKGFHGPYALLDIQMYLPFGMLGIEGGPAEFMTSRKVRDVNLLGRLRSGITVPQAQILLNVVAERIAREYPQDEKEIALQLFPELRARPNPDPDNVIGLVSALFLGLAGLVLLLACGNVANILLVRATVREREMAVRTALGAGRFRLIRQLLTESLLLALCGSVAGVALGCVGSWAMSRIQLQIDLPARLDFGLDWRILGYAVCAALLAGIMVGIVPALRASRTNLNAVLRAGGRGVVRTKHKLRSALVIAQVGGSLMLLIIAGLFARSLTEVRHADLGFNPSHIVNIGMDPFEIAFTKEQGREFYKELLRRVRSMPGVESAATAAYVPMGYINNADVPEVAGYDNPPGQPPPRADFNGISSDYFETMQIPLIRGRGFTEADDMNAPFVAIINETMAKTYWKDRDPIGRTFQVSAAPLHPLQVVGIAKDARYVNVRGPARPYFYLPFQQHFQLFSMANLQVRTLVPPGTMIPELQRTIDFLAPQLPLFDVKTQEQGLNTFNGFLLFQFGAVLAAALGMLGLVLAVIGVYGVISYATSQRTQEIGIRLALGASPSHILKSVLNQGLLIVAIGLACGLAASFAAARIVGDFVTVSATDPLTYISVSALLAAVALAACYIPARRAMRVDPIVALRYE